MPERLETGLERLVGLMVLSLPVLISFMERRRIKHSYEKKDCEKKVFRNNGAGGLYFVGREVSRDAKESFKRKIPVERFLCSRRTRHLFQSSKPTSRTLILQISNNPTKQQLLSKARKEFKDSTIFIHL